MIKLDPFKVYRLTIHIDTGKGIHPLIIGDFSSPMSASMASVAETHKRDGVIGVSVEEIEINFSEKQEK